MACRLRRRRQSKATARARPEGHLVAASRPSDAQDDPVLQSLPVFLLLPNVCDQDGRRSPVAAHARLQPDRQEASPGTAGIGYRAKRHLAPIHMPPAATRTRWWVCRRPALFGETSGRLLDAEADNSHLRRHVHEADRLQGGRSARAIKQLDDDKCAHLPGLGDYPRHGPLAADERPTASSENAWAVADRTRGRARRRGRRLEKVEQQRQHGDCRDEDSQLSAPEDRCRSTSP